MSTNIDIDFFFFLSTNFLINFNNKKLAHMDLYCFKEFNNKTYDSLKKKNLR